MIVVREQLNVKQRQAIAETPAEGVVGGGSVLACNFVNRQDGRRSGRAILARLLPSGLSTHRLPFEA
jgi:hypothetical protein